MPETVNLKVPTGAEWRRVEVKRKEDGFWFGKGLSEFAESLGVKYGHFLMFDYDGGSVFQVVAIDLSAAEIQYPAALCSIIDDEHQDGFVPASRCPKTEQVEDDANLGQGNKIKSKRARQKASKLGHTGSVNRRVETGHTIITKGKSVREVILNNEGKIQSVIQGRRLNQTSSEKAIARDKAYNAEEPVCIIALQPTYVCEKRSNGIPHKCQLLFPHCFIKEYFNLNIKFVTH